MRNRCWWILGLGVALSLPVEAWADVWDVGSPNDDGTATQNELTHGAFQMHDLAARPAMPTPIVDQDMYKLGQAPYSSWEILVDAVSTDAGFGITLDRVGADGTTVLPSTSGLSGLNLSRSLRWENSTASQVNTEHVRVKSSSCTTSCTLNDVYQLRAYDTTYAVSRFNNSGSQGTVLFIQNTTSYNVAATVYFWSNAGTLLGTPLSLTLTPKQLQVVNLLTITALVGQSGSITITNNGRYGDLKGKATALEPSTGYSFDTPMEPRPR